MTQAIRDTGMRRAIILIGAVVAAFFLASALTSVEPAAQTAGSTATNGKLAYYSYEAADADIYTINPDGTGKTNLTDEAPDAYAGADIEPAFSPDGSRIAFESDRSGEYTEDPNWPSPIFDVWVVNADGSGEPRRITTAEGQAPAWSPDGKQIAYSSSRDGNYEIWVENVDGTGTPRQITHTEHTEAGVVINTSPSWSVDGKIAYVSNKDNASNDQREIYVANADGTGDPVRLTTNPNFNNWAPEWSPDGKRIAFWRVQSRETCGPCDREVYVMDGVDSDGDGNGDDQINVTNDPAVDYQPDWSPDGTQISFVSNREDGEYSLWTVPAPQTASSTTPGVALLSIFTAQAAFAQEATSGPKPIANSSGAASADWGPSTSPTAACTIRGTTKADDLTGTMGSDVICGFGGNDTVTASGGKDVIKGGAGNDILRGQWGNDRLIGNAGSDVLFGGNGDDRVNSKDSVSDNDSLNGGTHVSGDEKATDATEKSIVGIP